MFSGLVQYHSPGEPGLRQISCVFLRYQHQGFVVSLQGLVVYSINDTLPIQAAKNSSRGFRSTKNFIITIYLRLGKLQFNLPAENSEEPLFSHLLFSSAQALPRTHRLHPPGCSFIQANGTSSTAEVSR